MKLLVMFWHGFQFMKINSNTIHPRGVIFSITDYILVKHKDIDNAVESLINEGYEVANYSNV